MRRFVTFTPAIITLATAAAFLYAVPETVRRIYSAELQAQVVLARQSLDDDDILERYNRAVRNIRSSVSPSVVHIQVESGENRWAGPSAASGWIYNADGHIITNAHVVRGVDPEGGRVGIQLFDGRTLRAAVIGVDGFTDIAVLKLDGIEGLIPARRATGQPVEPGERVFAFGSPFGFKFSMSEGIVSGVGRSARASGGVGFSNFIQTDAAVNPGNSGGPLADIRGRVVGMNVAIANARDAAGTANEGQSAGISFAIPLTTIESVVEQLKSDGKVRRGYLGIVFQNDGTGDGAVLDDQGNVVGRGIRIREIQEGGPAAAAGLLAGDVILTIDGNSITSFDVLRSVVSSKKPGEAVAVRYFREGSTADTTVTLGEMPASAIVPPGLRRAVEFRAGLALEDAEDGVRVTQIADEGPAARAGITVGSLITAVGGAQVRDPADLVARLSESGFLDGDRVSVTLRAPGDDGRLGEPRRVRIQIDPQGR
jgi:serine protease Do